MSATDIRSCYRFVDIGDGVTIICHLPYGHAGHCSPGTQARATAACDVVDGCLRPGGHAGAHKTMGDVRKAQRGAALENAAELA